MGATAPAAARRADGLAMLLTRRIAHDRMPGGAAGRLGRIDGSRIRARLNGIDGAMPLSAGVLVHFDEVSMFLLCLSEVVLDAIVGASSVRCFQFTPIK